MPRGRKDTGPLKTILTIVTGLLLVFAATRREWALWVAVAVGACGMFSPLLSRWIDRLWMGLANVMGMIFPKILLGFIFYCFLFPIALISRLFRKNDPLMLKDPGSSAYVTVNKDFNKASFEVPW